MKWKLLVHLCIPMILAAAFALVASAGGPFCWQEEVAGRGRPPYTDEALPAAQAGDRAAAERERLLAMGRELFFQKCGSCHDADGSKPMSDGPPLNERKVPEEKVSRVVDSRFKKATEEERRAVKLHINHFMKR